MAKYCYNYESGEYEYIERDGYSIDQGRYVYNWTTVNTVVKKRKKNAAEGTKMKTGSVPPTLRRFPRLGIDHLD